ncbi:MAG: GntR family transcriptional regulator [Clostridia bacterium]|nr:GntR family transcriptional regulator [Clostridia bacterium]
MDNISEMDNIKEQLVLDDNTLIPIYHRLASAIKKQIANGYFKEGDYIPTETQLAEMFNISRTTVRQAILKLCNDGLLERQRGKGTIVKRQKLMREFPGWSSFTEETKRMGKKPGTIVVSLETIDPPVAEIAEALQLEPEEKVVYLLRKRYADDELLGVSESYFNKKVWDKYELHIEDPFSMNNRSIYAFLEEKGVELIWAREWIEAGTADRKIARLLNAETGIPMLFLTRVVYGRGDIPIEYAINKFRADKYRINIVHKRYNS